MNREEQFTELKIKLVDGVERLQLEGKSMTDAATELLRVSILLSLSTCGPDETLQGMVALYEQLSAVYPKEAAIAEAGRSFPLVEGFA